MSVVYQRRRRMPLAPSLVARLCAPCAWAARKRTSVYFMLALFTIFSIVVFHSSNSELPRESQMEQRLADLHAHLKFLESLYHIRVEELMNLQNKLATKKDGITFVTMIPETMSPETAEQLKNISGTPHAARGALPKNLQTIRTPFVYQLLPHLLRDSQSLRPAYHMKGDRKIADYVIGVPTVKRDKESYLMTTLSHLVGGLRDTDINSTLIIVFVGETDLSFVGETASKIEKMFPKHVDSGLIEVLSPAASYYPDFDRLSPTLGDSPKRFKWRTKQNLDAMYLMAYAQTKGTYYLMLEDDVISRDDYMQIIKTFTASVSVSNPTWFFIDYSHIGGIGKLFRSSDLLHFITYVQLFYNSLPIDWLLESYLADRVCSIDKTSAARLSINCELIEEVDEGIFVKRGGRECREQKKVCAKSKLTIRPIFKTSLFQHIGLYSSLKGKIQKVKDKKFGTAPTFYPHKNPPADVIRTDIEEHADHSLKKAYEGQSFFWGIRPKQGDCVTFWFKKPTYIERFTFRSANVDHTNDKFYNTVVEVLPSNGMNFTQVGVFDEFGLADGTLSHDIGPINAIRLRVLRNSLYWVVLSEIELKEYDVSQLS